jgi:hypothetical protein
MASSGIASFSVYRDAMIASALRTLRVLQDGQTPTTNDITNGSEALNILLKNWQVQGFVLSLYQQVAIPCVAAQMSYTIGPSGANVTIPRPIRLFDGSFIRQTVSGVVTDTALEILSRQAYQQVTTKAVSGTTNSIYWEPSIYIAPAGGKFQTSPAVGYGTLYLYFPSVDNTFTIYANFQRPVYDMIAAGDEFDVPQEWFLAVKYGLATMLADEYEVPEDRCTRLFKIAEMYQKQLQDWQHDLADTNFAERRQQQEKVNQSEKPR